MNFDPVQTPQQLSQKVGTILQSNSLNHIHATLCTVFIGVFQKPGTVHARNHNTHTHTLRCRWKRQIFKRARTLFTPGGRPPWLPLCCFRGGQLLMMTGFKQKCIRKRGLFSNSRYFPCSLLYHCFFFVLCSRMKFYESRAYYDDVSFPWPRWHFTLMIHALFPTRYHMHEVFSIQKSYFLARFLCMSGLLPPYAKENNIPLQCGVWHTGIP